MPPVDTDFLEWLRRAFGVFGSEPKPQRFGREPLKKQELMIAVNQVYPKYLLPVGRTKEAVSIGGEKSLLLPHSWFMKAFQTLAGQWRELEIDPYFWLAFSMMEYMGNTVEPKLAYKLEVQAPHWPAGLGIYEDKPYDCKSWNDPIKLPSRGESSTKVTFEFMQVHGAAGVNVPDSHEQGFFFTPDAQRLLKARYLASNPNANTQGGSVDCRTNLTGYNIAAQQPGFVEKYTKPVVPTGQDPERGQFFTIRQWGFNISDSKVSEEDRSYQSFVLLRQHQLRVLRLMKTKDPCECRNCNDANLRPKPRHPRTYGSVPWALQLILGHGMVPYIYRFGLRRQGEVKRVTVTDEALSKQETLLATLMRHQSEDDRYKNSVPRARQALEFMRANRNKTLLVPKALVRDESGVMGKDEPMYGFTLADFIRQLSEIPALAQIIPPSSNMQVTQQVKAHFAKANRTYGH